MMICISTPEARVSIMQMYVSTNHLMWYISIRSMFYLHFDPYEIVQKVFILTSLYP